MSRPFPEGSAESGHIRLLVGGAKRLPLNPKASYVERAIDRALIRAATKETCSTFTEERFTKTTS